jgi:hypothetical protein
MQQGASWDRNIRADSCRKIGVIPYRGLAVKLTYRRSAIQQQSASQIIAFESLSQIVSVLQPCRQNSFRLPAIQKIRNDKAV